jgi:hypothetical protein
VPIVRLVLYTTKERQAHWRTMSIELVTATKEVSQFEMFDEFDEKWGMKSDLKDTGWLLT